ncbi:MAG TPA: AAA family ATPase [Candidatus Scybalomonas excrementigallinarum]|nr:AAA family ATPase [Candidatus Scybalomonas excrementigallinarum]
MEQFYISELKIKKVRHLNNITIPLSKNELKHLIITGRNGSGKTSVLEAIV